MGCRSLTILTKFSILDIRQVLKMPLVVLPFCTVARQQTRRCYPFYSSHYFNIEKRQTIVYFDLRSEFNINVLTINGRSHLRCSFKTGALKNFAKFTGKLLCHSFFFNKVAGLRQATLLKERLSHRCFPLNFCKIFKNTSFTEHLRTTASVLRYCSKFSTCGIFSKRNKVSSVFL